MSSAVLEIAFAVLLSASVCQPSLHDKGEWGLRVHNLTTPAPYLAGELIDRSRFNITLINFSKETRTHDHLAVAQRTNALQLRVKDPDGKEVARMIGHRPARDPFTEENKLRPSGVYTQDFSFIHFGYFVLGRPGRYQLEASVTIAGEKVTSPPIQLDIVEVSENAKLMHHWIAVEGPAGKLPLDEQERPALQQIRVGNQTILLFRRYQAQKNGGKAGAIRRITELPGDVEIKVAGASAAGKPLTITYADTNAPSGTTTIIINSVNGSPWTEADEAALQERLKKNPPPKP